MKKLKYIFLTIMMFTFLNISLDTNYSGVDIINKVQAQQVNGYYMAIEDCWVTGEPIFICRIDPVFFCDVGNQDTCSSVGEN